MVRVDFKEYEQLSVKKSTYERRMPYSYSNYAPLKVFGGEAYSSFSCNTGWITSQDAVNEVTECLQSPETWLCRYGEDPLPVIISDVEQEFQRYGQSGPVSFTVKLIEAAYKTNTY